MKMRKKTERDGQSERDQRMLGRALGFSLRG